MSTGLTPEQWQALQAEIDAGRARNQSRQDLIDQFVAGMAQIESDLTLVNTRIAANAPLSAVEVRTGFLHVLSSLKWIGDRIKDGTIEVDLPHG